MSEEIVPEAKSDTVENVPSEEVGPAVRPEFLPTVEDQGPESDATGEGWSSDVRQPISPSNDPAKRLNPTAGDPGFGKWDAATDAVPQKVPEATLSGSGVENGDPNSDRPAVQTESGPVAEVKE